MQRIKQLRSMILAFVTGLAISNLSTGVKLCIVVPLVIVWLMSYDEKVFHQNKNRKRGI